MTQHLRMDEGARSCSMGVHSQYVELAAEVFRLLADPTRIRLVLALRGGELPVHRLAELVASPPPPSPSTWPSCAGAAWC